MYHRFNLRRKSVQGFLRLQLSSLHNGTGDTKRIKCNIPGKSLTAPFNEIEKAAAEMEAGSLGAIIEYKSQDELGSLAVSMQTLCTDMKEIIVDIGRILQSLADGDFHVTSLYLNLFVGDYEPILSSMRLIRDNLNDAMTQISQSADQVALSSEQLAEQNAK